MDPAGAGALIGVSIMVFGMVGCWVREKCLQKKKPTEHTHLLTSTPLAKMFQKKQTSMRDFFDKNTKGRALEVVRTSEPHKIDFALTLT